MSTHSNIGILRRDGTVEVIYCHFDGYLGNNGLILLKNYKTVKSVEDLLRVGSLNSLRGDDGQPEPMDQIDYNPAIEFKSLHQFCIYKSASAYSYLFDAKKRRWIYSEYPKTKTFHPLTMKAVRECPCYHPLREEAIVA